MKQPTESMFCYLVLFCTKYTSLIENGFPPRHCVMKWIVLYSPQLITILNCPSVKNLKTRKMLITNITLLTRILLNQTTKKHISFYKNLKFKNMSTKPHNNIVAICHMRSTNDKEHNRQQVLQILNKSSEQNASVSANWLLCTQNTLTPFPFSLFSCQSAVILWATIGTKRWLCRKL